MNEKPIWQTLMKAINNPFGVAGLMGNLFAESSLNPYCKTGGDKNLSGEEYSAMVDSGKISNEKFIYDGIAFGLVQWRYWSRKEQLYLYAVAKGSSIGNIELQLNFMLNELKTYKTVWNTLLNAKSVKEASDIVMERYEKPGNITEKAKEKRAEFGKRYFDQFAYADKPSAKRTYVETKADRVIIRIGNGKNYGTLARIEKKGTKYPYVAKSDNNWYAIEYPAEKAKHVGWISGEYAEIVNE